jgi:trimethylamine--corrinoid protein Co-methyltransferase
MKLARMAVLSDSEIADIHEATLHILTHCGVNIGSPRMLSLLQQHGADVEAGTCRVRFSRTQVEDAIATIPPSFDVFNRDGEYTFTLGDGEPKVAAGHNAVFWVDADTGQRRLSTVADVEQFAHLCEYLPGIDMIGIPVMPQDVMPPRSTLLHGVKAVIEHSRKPIFFSTDACDINRGCIELLRAVFAGDLSCQVYGITQLSPTSPLFWEAGVLDAVIDTMDTGVPIAILPEPNAGVSAPITLAGLLTVNNAECLSGMVMIQLLRPGTRVLYANSWTTTDMRTGAALVGSIETSICRVAGAQLARFYQVPSHTTAPNSDNHAHDEQNACEKTFSLLAAMGAGNDLVVNCGMFATGMTCSHAQLLMDEEIAQMARRMMAGIRVRSDDIACDVIEAVGPQGESYLTLDHTMERLRTNEYFVPQLAVRGPFSSWESAGAKDTYALAGARAQRLLTSPSVPVSDEIQHAMERIIRNYR